jgi:hypothetical protein
MSRLFYLALIVFVLGCGKKDGDAPQPVEQKPEPKADVTLALDTFLKEHRADEKGTRAKYVGKELEFAATVMGVSDVAPFPIIMVDAGKEPKSGLTFSQDFRLDLADAGKEKELRLLSRGQNVTIRARGTSLPSQYGLEKIRIIDSGPSPARVTTVAEITKIEKNVPELQKFYTKEALVRVKITELRANDLSYLGSVTDPDAPTGTKSVLLRRPLFGTFKREFEALKVGDVITILAGVEGEQVPLAFYGARIVNEAPAGLKMPGEK